MWLLEPDHISHTQSMVAKRAHTSNPTHIGRCLSDNPSYRPAIGEFLVDLSTGPNRTATGPVPVSV